jgi:CRISPR-associated protein Cas2
MLALIVYDIPDNKRRTKLAKFLEGYGRRTQLSVFECFLTLDEMRHLHQLVERRVKPEEDNVRFYWISSEAMTSVLTIGSLTPQSPPNYYVV